MAKFLTGNALNAALDNILESANQYLLLISPYIKLHDRIKSSLLIHKGNPEFQMVIVFGKNENDVSKSVSRNDIEFFTQFLNVDIRHENRLHAKYYANETDALITSMNLYGHSQNNNIEAGILAKYSRFNMPGSDRSLDKDAFECFDKVIDQATQLYKKTPEFDKGLVGTGFNKKYLGSKVELNKLDEYFNEKRSIERPLVSIPASYDVRSHTTGYCIRTGTQIPFNPKRPMCDEAYKSWSRFSNPDYVEKFCHFSGERSDGETSFSKPILKKNWNKAKEIHAF